MSVRAVSWVLHESRSTGNDRLVLIVIADEADNDGLDAFPSVDRIAELARLPKRTVLRSIGRLEAAGDLLVRRPDHPGRGRFNRYALTMGRPPTALAGALGWPAPKLDPTVAAEWAAEVEGDTVTPTPDGPHPGDKAGEDGTEKARKGDTGACFGNRSTPSGALDPTLIDTRGSRRRGLDPPPPSPIDRTARAARVLALEGRQQVESLRSIDLLPADAAAAQLAAARDALSRSARQPAAVAAGDGSSIRTPNEDDDWPGDDPHDEP